ERHARPSWLAPSPRRLTAGQTPGGTNNVAGVALATTMPPANVPSTTASPQLPLWLQAAVRLGTRFLRIAAAGEPPATSSFMPPQRSGSACCAECGRVHPPVMDEYYFWLVNSEYYDPAVLNPADPALYQDADWGVVAADMKSDWHRSDRLPQLLLWPKQPMVKLAWCRVHNGEFQTPRYTDDGAHVNAAGGAAELEFIGRDGDSLRFRITNAAILPRPGYTDTSPWGFRYDIAPDTAVVLPEVVSTPPAPGPFPPSLPAYPFFLYFTPGAPLEPSMYSTAMTVAGTLRAHCRYEAALKWYELYFAPGDKDLRWATCRTPQNPQIPGTPVDSNNPTGANPSTNTVASTPVATRSTRGIVRTDQDPCCDTLVKSDLASRQRSIILAYLETLLQHAQAAMCRHSPEAYAIARLRLDT